MELCCRVLATCDSSGTDTTNEAIPFHKVIGVTEWGTWSSGQGPNNEASCTSLNGTSEINIQRNLLCTKPNRNQNTYDWLYQKLGTSLEGALIHFGINKLKNYIYFFLKQFIWCVKSFSTWSLEFWRVKQNLNRVTVNVLFKAIFIVWIILWIVNFNEKQKGTFTFYMRKIGPLFEVSNSVKIEQKST